MRFESGRSVLAGGPLAPLAVGLRGELAGRGYSVRSAAETMRLFARLNHWLGGRGLTVDDVTAGVIEEFFQCRRAEGCRKWLTSRSLTPLLEFLQVTPADTINGEPVDGLLAQYRDYLRCRSKPGRTG